MHSVRTLPQPKDVAQEIKRNGVSHLVWLPDTETRELYAFIVRDKFFNIIPVCREGECVPIAAGLWVGGKRSLVIMQNRGLFESGDSLRGLAIDHKIPLVLMIGYAGWSKDGVFTDSAATFSEPILHAWGLKTFIVASNNTIPYISQAFRESESLSTPIAVLIATR